ncbi:hypothetical protein ASH01_01220 [Terrabacter sp. Soil811]|uniref:hypothetical protein n=1 Tax=Terrabacter sp. Soil811 TaxID=1736419 RepID=UPI0006F44064|nr:hypothetical protein [Terrabacter sp. Soil811]KRF48365.1 hypothetical protein ASH01_01220 [Terrabacter sp. Soil811]
MTAVPGRGPLDVLVVYVPVGDTDAVLGALFAAGAGAVGDYRECAFVTRGTGQFRPVEGATPTIGVVGDLEKVAENRVELVLERRLRADVVAALPAAHPYEEPAFHVLETADVDPA